MWATASSTVLPFWAWSSSGPSEKLSSARVTTSSGERYRPEREVLSHELFTVRVKGEHEGHNLA